MSSTSTSPVNIPQLDGNITCFSDSSLELPEIENSVNSTFISEIKGTAIDCAFSPQINDNMCENPSNKMNISQNENFDKIPVHITLLNRNNINFSKISEISPPAWYDSYVPVVHNRKRQLKTLKRDNKFEKTSELPVISVPNMRSIFPKINNFIDDMKMRNISVAMCSETWHREDKKKHKNDIERLLHMEGLKFLSTPRPPGKRGGGCAIIADLSQYTLDRLDISNEHKLEICWGILRPKNLQNCHIKEYIVAAFYFPPRSRKKEKLISHIITNSHMLITKYPNCGLLIGGDKKQSQHIFYFTRFAKMSPSSF